MADAAPICTDGGAEDADCSLVAFPPVRVLLLSAKHLFLAAKRWRRSVETVIDQNHRRLPGSAARFVYAANIPSATVDGV